MARLSQPIEVIEQRLGSSYRKGRDDDGAAALGCSGENVSQSLLRIARVMAAPRIWPAGRNIASVCSTGEKSLPNGTARRCVNAARASSAV